MKVPRLFLSLLKWLTILTLFTATALVQGAEKDIGPGEPLPELKDSEPLLRGALIFPEKATPIKLPAGYKLLYTQTFEKPDAIQDFVMTDAKAWKIANTKGQSSLELVAQSQYKPLVRSPVNMALIADKVFRDFVLEADLVQTGKEYGHRDMCLFFGFQSPTNFYYAHIASAADDHAHNVFIVNGAPRAKIARETTQGVNWGLGIWHKVKLERKVSDGSIKVYFDDMFKPIMVAEDKTFPSGYIGFGSFDDTGMVDNIKIWAPSVAAKKMEFFTRPAN